ncbi:hypothetical protein VNO77_19804 [Canavalia gladiata]|uniref:Uncharacterized protein n=1 Tax=Canavalia gladiata TaxID=3824 RepID=A0AAN9QPY7_CANGL
MVGVLPITILKDRISKVVDLHCEVDAPGFVSRLNDIINRGIPFEIGKGNILIGEEGVALLGYGIAVQNCLAITSLVERHDLRLIAADAHSYKTLDCSLTYSLEKSHEVLVTLIGRLSSHVVNSDLAVIALGSLEGQMASQGEPIVLKVDTSSKSRPRSSTIAAGVTYLF